jgi:putative ABC transport system ATP-binding protein
VVERVDRALELVGMHERGSRLPAQLSGGEMQRVAVARVLASDAHVILADEPTGNLDSSRGKELMDLLRALVDREQRSLVLVTHDAGAAARADRCVRLRDGRIETTAQGAGGGVVPGAFAQAAAC